MISIVQLGTIDYATGLNLQQQLVALRKENKIGDVLLLLEHKPVITLGRNAKAANVVASPELLRQRGVEQFECDRGGDVTFHGPGQLVGYPIFDLRGYARSSTNLNDLSSRASRSESDGEPRDHGVSSTLRKTMGAIEFVRRLEEVLIRACADFKIPTKRVPSLTGVWTDPAQQSSPMDSHPLSSRAAENDSKNRSLQPRDLGLADATKDHVATAASAESPESKIAAIGVHISRAVTSHGFALNVNTDLSYFNLIIPCGITTKPVTSMQQELGHKLDLNAVAESICRNFGVVFQSQILWLDSLDHLLCGAGTPVKKRSSRTVKSDVEERPFKGRVSRES